MGRKVLIADDDKAMRALFVHALKTLGVEDVMVAGDGEEALKFFERSDFELILLDWDMPKKTGLEVLQAIRAKPSDIPVIMITAKRTREGVVEAAEAGVTDYLVKPIDHNALTEKLARYCQPGGAKVDTSGYRCRNMMNPTVVTIGPDASVDDAVALLLRHHISGLPVVDDNKRLLGIITEYNLLQAITRADFKTELVRSVMNVDVMTVDENTIPLKVVGIMQKHKIRRVPVLRNGELVGIISRRDILRYVRENEEVLRGFLEELKSLDSK